MPDSNSVPSATARTINRPKPNPRRLMPAVLATAGHPSRRGESDGIRPVIIARAADLDCAVTAGLVQHDRWRRELVDLDYGDVLWAAPPRTRGSRSPAAKTRIPATTSPAWCGVNAERISFCPAYQVTSGSSISIGNGRSTLTLLRKTPVGAYPPSGSSSKV